MDKIIINHLRAHGILGVYPHERNTSQDILISVTLFTDTRPAARSDKLEKSIDYDTLANTLKDHAENIERFTIEALAEDLARLCFQEQKVEKVIIRVEKPDALPSAGSAGVEIERTRDQE